MARVFHRKKGRREEERERGGKLEVSTKPELLGEVRIKIMKPMLLASCATMG